MGSRHILSFGTIALLVALAACGGGGGGADDGGGGGDGGDASGPAPGTDIVDGAGAVGTAPTLSAKRTGEGTFYGATGQGNCSFDASPGNLMVAAMNHADYAGSAACGEFVEVTGPKGTVTVRITDRCPECKPGDIDLSEQAFAKIADPVAGRVPISWNVVAGNLSGPVAYRYKEGSTRFYVAIQVRNHRLPITGLDIKPSGSTAWIPVERLEYNYFVHPSAIAAGPVQVRVTALGGKTLLQTLPEPEGGLVVPGMDQL